MEYGYDSALAICAVALIPVFIWWYKQSTYSHVKWFGYFTILFFAHGSIELTRVINDTILRYMFELPLLILYFKQLLAGRYVMGYPGRIFIPLFLAVSIVSATQTSTIMFILFILYVLEIFMMLIYFRHNFEDEDTALLTKLFINLAISQIFANFIKYFMVGVTEPYIGSMASHEGGITTLFSLCSYCVSLEMYFVSRKKRILLLVAGFILFGMIGCKRALVFFIPAFYFVILIIHSIFTDSLSYNFKKMIGGAILMPLLFVIMCIMNPSFNPEEKVGGTFDLDYVLEYSDKYNNGGFGGDDEAGRAQAHAIVHEKILNDDIFHQLFGYGAGSFVASSFNNGSKSSEAKMAQYGVGYSMGIGYLYMLAQVGFLGVFCYFMLFILPLVDLYKRTYYLKKLLNIDELGWCVSAISILISVLVISFIYNMSSFYFNCFSMLMMWFVSYAYKILDRVQNAQNSTYLSV